jgi:hypothetical protein
VEAGAAHHGSVNPVLPRFAHQNHIIFTVPYVIRYLGVARRVGASFYFHPLSPVFASLS